MNVEEINNRLDEDFLGEGGLTDFGGYLDYMTAEGREQMAQ